MGNETDRPPAPLIIFEDNLRTLLRHFTLHHGIFEVLGEKVALSVTV